MNGRRSKLIRAAASAWRAFASPLEVWAAPSRVIIGAVGGVDSPAVRRKLAREVRRSVAPEALAGAHPVRRKRPTISGARELTREEALAAELRAEAYAAEAAASRRPRRGSRLAARGLRFAALAALALGGGF